jgi:hypothetical protein
MKLVVKSKMGRAQEIEEGRLFCYKNEMPPDLFVRVKGGAISLGTGKFYDIDTFTVGVYAAVQMIEAHVEWVQ